MNWFDRFYHSILIDFLIFIDFLIQIDFFDSNRVFDSNQFFLSSKSIFYSIQTDFLFDFNQFLTMSLFLNSIYIPIFIPVTAIFWIDSNFKPIFLFHWNRFNDQSSVYSNLKLLQIYVLYYVSTVYYFILYLLVNTTAWFFFYLLFMHWCVKTLAERINIRLGLKNRLSNSIRFFPCIEKPIL